MHISLAGPFQLNPFQHHFNRQTDLPEGLGGIPVVQLAQMFLQRGHQVTVFTLDPKTKSGRWFHGDQMNVFVGPYRPRGRARDLFAAERLVLTEAMKATDVPFIHAHWTYEFALAALESNRPTLVTAHDAPLRILSLDPSPYRAARTLMATQVLQRAEQMSAVSPYVVRHLKLMGHLGPVAVVPNGVTVEGEARPWSQAGRLSLAAVLNGGWKGLKNGRRLLQAFSIVQRALPSSTLSLYGGGLGEGEDAQAWATAQGLAEGVLWKGYVPHGRLLDDLRLHTDILVHPALEESFGMTILEGMMLGLPVLAGRRSGAVPWVTDNGRGALLVDVTSVEALALGMLRLATEPALRNSLAQHGQTYAQQNFSLETVADQYEAIYRSLV